MRHNSELLSGQYRLAQHALSDLKAAIVQVLEISPREGLTNSEVGRSLGIYQGHVGHEGHIPRTLLAIMESEGVVAQDEESKRWTLLRRWKTDEAKA